MIFHAGSPITTEQPSDSDLPSQNNDNLVAGVSVTVIMIAIMFSGIMILTVCIYCPLRQRKTLQGIVYHNLRAC